MHTVHSLHNLIEEKRKRKKKLDEDKQKLSKTKAQLNSRLDEFLRGRQVKMNALSSQFIRQALAVDREKKILDSLRQQIQHRARVQTNDFK